MREEPPKWVTAFGWSLPCEMAFKLPYRPGEKCYVREAWTTTRAGMLLKLPERVLYKADFVGQEGFVDWKWSSPVTMPQWAARSFVTVLSCEPVRVSEVTEEDAIKMGYVDTPTKASKGMYHLGARDKLIMAFKEKCPDKEWAWRIESEGNQG